MIALLSNWRLLLAGGLVLAFLASNGASYFKGRADSASECQTAALRSQIANLEKQARDNSQTLAEAQRRALQRAQEVDDLSRKVLDYEDQLESRSECHLSDDDAERLRAIQ